MHGRLIRSRYVVAATVLLVALSGGAYALAASSPFVGAHGNINTCVPPTGGEVNVWKPGHRCSGGRVGLAFRPAARRAHPGPRARRVQPGAPVRPVRPTRAPAPLTARR